MSAKETTHDHPHNYESIETGYQAVRWHEPVVYELSRKGSRNDIIPEAEEEIRDRIGDVLARIPDKIRRTKALELPELSEPEVMRHYLRLSQQTFGFDSGINIGLGTYTMKYNPKINEQLTRLPGLTARLSWGCISLCRCPARC